MHRYLSILVLLLCGAALVAVFLPWKFWLEAKLTAVLREQGFPNAHLTVSTLGLKGIVLSDVTLSSNPPLVLQHVTIGYSLPELVSGRLHDLTLSGLTLEVQQTPNKWNVSGLDGWHTNTPSTPFAIPMSADQLTKYPQNAKLEDSMLHVLGNQWKLDLPLRVTWQQLPVPQLDYNASALKLTAGEVQAETSKDGTFQRR